MELDDYINQAKRTAIHCPTQGEFDQIIKMLESRNLTFKFDTPDAIYKQFGERTCINISDGCRLGYADREFYEGQNFRVFKACNFLTPKIKDDYEVF